MVSGGLYDFDTLFDQDVHILIVVNGAHHGKEIDIHGKGFVSEFVNAVNGIGKCLAGFIHGRSQYAQTTRVGNGRGEFRVGDPHHGATDDDDRVLDAEHFGNLGLKHGQPPRFFTAEAQSSQRVKIFPFAAESPAKGNYSVPPAAGRQERKQETRS
jgi:hypothetical protein